MWPESLETALKQLIGEQQLESLLILGDLPEVNWEAVLPADAAPRVNPGIKTGIKPGITKVTRLDAGDAGILPQQGMQDLVAVGRTLEWIPRQEGAKLLASLRDLYARRVILRLEAGGDWQHQDIMALGFMQLTAHKTEHHQVSYYGFDLHTYKTTPDWLNPRFWANPELFDRHRW